MLAATPKTQYLCISIVYQILYYTVTFSTQAVVVYGISSEHSIRNSFG